MESQGNTAEKQGRFLGKASPLENFQRDKRPDLGDKAFFKSWPKGLNFVDGPGGVANSDGQIMQIL